MDKISFIESAFGGCSNAYFARRWPSSEIGVVGYVEMTSLVGSLLRAVPHLAIAVAILVLSGAAGAQTLEQALQSVTADDCAALNSDFMGTGPDPNFGGQLGQLCVFSSGPGGGGSPGSVPSAGGGTGSVQGSGASLAQLRAMKRRQNEPCEDNEKKNGKGNRTDNINCKEKRKINAANQFASLSAQNVTEDNFSFGSLNVFVSGDFEVRDRDRTTFEDAYDSHLWNVTLGGDYPVTKEIVVGIAAKIGRQTGDFSSGGDFTTDTYGGILYGTYSPAALSGVFADINLGYARKRFEVDRFVSGLFNFNPDDTGFAVSGTSSSTAYGNEFSSRLLIGKDFSHGRFTFGPRAGLNYLLTNIEQTTESGNTGLELVYDERNVQSLQTTLGLQASAAFSTGIGVLVPQLAAEWVHEFKNDQRSIDVHFAQDLRPDPVEFSFQNEKPDRNFFNVRLGLVAVLSNGFQMFAEGRSLLGHRYFDNYGGAIGIRKEF